MISGFAVLLLIPTIYIFSIELQNIHHESSIKEFDITIDRLTNALITTCYMGEGARQTVEVYIPPGMSISSKGNIVIYNYSYLPTSISKLIPCNVSIPSINVGTQHLVLVNYGGLINVS